MNASCSSISLNRSSKQKSVVCKMASLKAEKPTDKSGISQPSGQVKKESAAKTSGTTPKTRASKAAATAPKKTEQKPQPKKKVYIYII